MKLNGKHPLLAYIDDLNLLGDNTDTIMKNKEMLIDVSKEVGLEIKIEETKYILLSHHQNAGQDHGMKIAKRIVCKCYAVHIFGNVSNTSEFEECCFLGCDAV
jgi:polynucleotide 5'-kinase involved in rRNA processing